MHLKRRSKRLSFFSQSSLSVLFVAAIIGGCSSDFSRFTDGIDKSSIRHGKNVQKPPADIVPYPPAPGNNAYSSKVESSNLAPPQNMSSSDNYIGGEYHRDYQASSPKINNTKPQYSGIENSEYKSPNLETKNLEHNRIIYTVVAGDTLSGIASRYNIKIAAIKNENGLKGDKILIGQKLTLVNVAPASSPVAASAQKMKAGNMLGGEKTPLPLPEPAGPSQNLNGTNTEVNNSNKETVQADSAIGPQNTVSADNRENKDASMVAPSVAATTPLTGFDSTKIVEKAPANVTDKTLETTQSKTVKTDTPIGEDSAPMIWPVRGNIISSYGQRTGTTTNDGIDIAVPEGTAVKAADNGTVIYAGDGLKEFGNTILIRHDDNIVTVYGHNSKLLVQRGSQVKKGDEIAQSGSSGNASVAKLHFEVRKNSAPVNPMRYLPSVH